MLGVFPRMASGRRFENTSFVKMLPIAHVNETLLPEKNKMIGRQLSFDELMRFLGSWCVIVCFPVVNRSSFSKQVRMQQHGIMNPL